MTECLHCRIVYVSDVVTCPLCGNTTMPMQRAQDRWAYWYVYGIVTGFALAMVFSWGFGW